MILHGIEAGQGPPVVLLHGLFGSAGNLGAVQRGLAGRFRVVSLDLRNHGASPHAADMSYPVMAADVLDTLAARGIGTAALVGHSMGGKVAMAAALAAPERVGRLAVADIAPAAYPPGFRGFAESMLALDLSPGLTRAAAAAALAPGVPDPGMRAFLLQNLRPGAAPSWRIGLPEIAAALPRIEGWDVPPSRFDGPALFVSGERSDYVRPEHRTIIRGLFPAARFVVMKGAGHWVHADNPAGFVAILDAFLA